MEKKFRFFTFIAFLLLISTPHAKCAIINGFVTGNKDKAIKVFYPFNDFATVRVAQEKSIVNLDSTNKFSFKLSILRPAYITLYIDYNPVDLIVDNSSNLFVEIHLDSIKKDGHKNWLIIKGKYSKGNLHYNEYNFNPYAKYKSVTDFFSKMRNYQIPHMQKGIDSLVKKELSPFDSLLINNVIDSTFWKIVSKNIQSLLYFEIIRHPLTSFDENKIMPASEITSLLNWLFKKCDPLDSDLLYGLNTTFYIEKYFLVKAQKKENKRLYQQISDSIIKIQNKQFVLSATYKHFFDIIDSKMRENLWGNALRFNQAMFKGIVTNDDIQIFKFIFPESKWIPYIDTDSVNVSIMNSNQYDSLEIHFIRNKGVDLKAVLDQFKGQYILIDIWATWCIPCRQEFSYYKTIDSVLNQKKIVKLFISLDNYVVEQTWKFVLRQYNLKGHHLMAPKEMIEDIKAAFFPNEESMLIPRYILIDKKGKIVNVDAPRPSDRGLKQLLESLETSSE